MPYNPSYKCVFDNSVICKASDFRRNLNLGRDGIVRVDFIRYRCNTREIKEMYDHVGIDVYDAPGDTNDWRRWERYTFDNLKMVGTGLDKDNILELFFSYDCCKWLGWMEMEERDRNIPFDLLWDFEDETGSD